MNFFAEVEGRTGKYLPRVHDARTDLIQLRSIFFTRPSLFLSLSFQFAVRGVVQLFLALLTPWRMALIRGRLSYVFK